MKGKRKVRETFFVDYSNGAIAALCALRGAHVASTFANRINEKFYHAEMRVTVERVEERKREPKR